MKLPAWRLPSQIKAMLPGASIGLRWALTIACPILLFLCFFNPNVLNPTRIGWLMEADWGQHVLGWNAFRHVSWEGLNHESLLGAPVGLSIIYTDSNPLFAFFFKTIRTWLPDHFQYIGPWFFICVCLHFFVAYRLIRPHAPNRWAALGGAIALSALPCLYYRMRHDTLMAQWLILWALHLFINVADDTPPVMPADLKPASLWRTTVSWFKNGAKMRGYAALLGVTGLIHPYILFMVAAIWGGDVLKRFWPAARAMDRKVIFDSLLRAAFVFVWPLITLGISGSYAQGQSPGAGGFGYYSMGLDAPFNPVRPEFSAILKAVPQDAGQGFEGYQYLGFGLLVLLATATILWFLTPEAKKARPFLLKLRPLALPFLALFLIALSNHVQIYSYTLLNLGVPQPLKPILAVLRASGRFFWPISYCAVLAALVVLYKSRPKVMAVLLPLVLVVQAYDLNGFAATMRNATQLAASPQVYYLTPDPTWDKLVAQAKGIDFYPANVHFNDKLFYELTWRATSAGKPVNTMYAARENIIQLAHEQDGQDAFLHGQVNNDRLFVFLKQCDAPRELQPRLRMLDGVWIIPPASSDIDLPKPQWSPIRADVRFGWLDQGVCLLDENWSQPDNDGVWSEGPRATVMIPIKHMQFDTPTPPQVLDLKLRAQSHKPVKVTVMVNGTKISDIDLTHTKSVYTLRLPASALRGESLKVRFLVHGVKGGLLEAASQKLANPTAALTGADPASSSANGRSALTTPPKKDDKALGIKLIDLQLVPPKPAPAGPVSVAG